ncbi:MAG: hypothetical protein NVSMB64_20670 [Candidatus Velthaea sp.]
MIKKTMTAAATKEAEKILKAARSEQASRDAEAESARIRAMFDEDRRVLARRYGGVSLIP